MAGGKPPPWAWKTLTKFKLLNSCIMLGGQFGSVILFIRSDFIR
jgi:hypothetical protein